MDVCTAFSHVHLASHNGLETIESRVSSTAAAEEQADTAGAPPARANAPKPPPPPRAEPAFADSKNSARSESRLGLGQPYYPAWDRSGAWKGAAVVPNPDLRVPRPATGRKVKQAPTAAGPASPLLRRRSGIARCFEGTAEADNDRAEAAAAAAPAVLDQARKDNMGLQECREQGRRRALVRTTKSGLRAPANSPS